MVLGNMMGNENFAGKWFLAEIAGFFCGLF